jgi:hypothetical protein
MMARTLTLLADGHHSRLVHKYGGDLSAAKVGISWRW